jgi:defect-in-organelle-trafficking protein DotC
MRTNLFTILLATTLIATGAALASPYNYNADGRDEPRNAAPVETMPQEMKDLQEVQKSDAMSGGNKSSSDNAAPNSEGDPGHSSSSGSSSGNNAVENAVEEEKDLSLKIRRDSQKEAALSYGARGGLAFRTKMIMDDLRKNTAALDRIYNFRRLLIKAPSNMFIEPPIISEALNNLIVSPEGDSAAVADSIYEISRKARIVSAPRSWHEYLERTWASVEAPPDVLLPETDAERKAWRLWIGRGWQEGYKQADEIFQADLNRLTADFEGMVRYRVLLAQNKISAPYATMVDRGVTGVQTETTVAGRPMKITNEMRIGDRAIEITQPVTLRPDNSAQNWQPPVETSP